MLYFSEGAKSKAVTHSEPFLLQDGVLTVQDLPQNNTLQHIL